MQGLKFTSPVPFLSEPLEHVFHQNESKIEEDTGSTKWTWLRVLVKGSLGITQQSWEQPVGGGAPAGSSLGEGE